MTYHGHIQNGVVVFDEPVTLPEGAKVRVEPVPPAIDKHPATTDTLYDRLRDLIGSVPDLPPDASVNLDHYLYGHPKRE